MKSIEQIKDEVAVKHNFKRWKDTMHDIGRRSLIKMMEEVSTEYAKEACKQQREMCAEDLPTDTSELAIQCILNTPLAI